MIVHNYDYIIMELHDMLDPTCMPYVKVDTFDDYYGVMEIKVLFFKDKEHFDHNLDDETNATLPRTAHAWLYGYETQTDEEIINEAFSTLDRSMWHTRIENNWVKV